MNEFTLTDAFSQLQNDIKGAELSKNENLFLSSAGFSLHTFISGNKLNFYDWYDQERYNTINSYFNNNAKYLIKIYNILGEKISIGKILSDISDRKIEEFDYVKDSIKMFYANYMTEGEKSRVIHFLNEVPKRFLQEARSIDYVSLNINSLIEFFELMYYITDKRFRYEEKVAYDLLETNKYHLHKAFFNTLRNILVQMKKRFSERDETTLLFVDNIESLLSKVSEDFNVSMAKSVFK